MPGSIGHLNPGARDVVLDRFELGPGLEDLVRHVWVAQWSVPPGQSRPQRVLTYPAFNAILSPDGARLTGPDPRLYVEELAGTGWVVGILLRAAAGPALTSTRPAALVGADEPLHGAPLESVAAVMGSTRPRGAALTDRERLALVGVLRSWLLPLAARIHERGRLVNEACRIAEEDEVNRAVDLAAHLGVSPRSLERAVKAHVGLTPKWLIECRRIQRAATTLFAAPTTDLSGLAHTLGYADYAHFCRQYKRVLGETPDQTRREAPPTAALAS